MGGTHEPPEVRSLHLQQWEYTEEAGTTQRTRLSTPVPGVRVDQDSKTWGTSESYLSGRIQCNNHPLVPKNELELITNSFVTY